jgi:hypothetical protein
VKVLIVFTVAIILSGFSASSFSSDKKMAAYHQMQRPSQIESDNSLTRPSHIFSRGIYKPRIFPTY